MKILVFLVGLVALVSCGENSVSINVKNSINTVSEQFISYEINFSELINEFVKEKTLQNLISNAPAYIKLDGFTSYLKNDKTEKFNTTDVTLMFELLR